MKKVLKRTMAVLLTVVMLLTAAPLSGFVGLDFGLEAKAISEEEEYVPPVDYSYLTPNQYMTKLMLNYNYTGIATPSEPDGHTIPQGQLLYFLNADVASFARVMIDEIHNNTAFMSSVYAWEALTFDPSTMADDAMKQEDYYIAILFSILDLNFNDSDFLDALNCNTNETIISLSSSVTSLVEAQLNETNLNLKNVNMSTLTSAQQHELLNTMYQNGLSEKFYSQVSDNIGVIDALIDGATTVYDFVSNVSKYSQLSDLGECVKDVLYQIWTNCPSSNAAMKTAAKKVYDICDDEINSQIYTMIEAGEQIFNMVFSEVIKEVWKVCLNSISSNLAAGVLIGQAIGKAISNFCFSTDAIIEQYYALNALVCFEDVMVSAVNSCAAEYKSNESTQNADAFMKSVEMLLSTYILGCDYVYDFAYTVETKGLVNTITNCFGENETVEFYRESTDSGKNNINLMKSSLINLEGYRWTYELDAPSAYKAYFETNEVSTPAYSAAEEPVYFEPSINSETNNSSVLIYRVESEGNITIIDCHVSSCGALVIPSEIGGFAVNAISSSAFYGCTGLTEIEIPGSVAEIGYQAFKNCTNLEKVTLNDGLKTIGYCSFTGTKIKEITIPKTVTTTGYPNGSPFYGATELKRVVFEYGMLTIPYNVLKNCTSVTSVVIPEGVTTIGSCAFDGCTGFISITIPASVTTIDNKAFYGCESLMNVTIPTSVITIDSDAFNGCIGLTEIEIPGSVTEIGNNAFKNCTNLEKVTLNDGLKTIGYCSFTGTKIKEITIPKTVTTTGYPNGSPFYGATELKRVVFEYGMLTIPYNVLKNCTSVTSVVIPEGVTTIGSNAFDGCIGLISITIPVSVTTIDNKAFYGCESLMNVTIPTSVITIDSDAFNGCTGLTEIEIPRSVTEIGNNAFKNCTKLEKVTLNDGLKTIGYGSFTGTKIKEIKMPKTVTTGYPNGSPFYGATELKRVVFEYGTLAIPYNVLKNCTSVTSVVIPEGVTTIGSNAFSNCKGLTNVTIPTSVITIDSDAFNGCTGLTEIEIPGSVTEIGNNAFKNCTKLEKVTLNDGLKTIGYGSFTGTKIKEIKMPKTVTTGYPNGSPFYGATELKRVVFEYGTLAIPYNVLKNCTSVTSVVIPEGVTTIGSNAFSGCKGLTSVTIPASVTTIDSSALSGCSDVTIYGNPDSFAQSFAENNNIPFVSFECEHTHVYVKNQLSNSGCVDGYSGDTYCSNCGILLSTGSVLPATGHNYEVAETVESTCSDPGYVKYVCSVCGNSYKVISAVAGHSYIDESVAATCEYSGYIKHECSVCGYSYKSDFTPLAEHTYELTTHVDATCEHSGKDVYRCSVCGYSYIVVTPMLDHVYCTSVANFDNNTYVEYDCVNCDDSYLTYVPKNVIRKVDSNFSFDGRLIYGFDLKSDEIFRVDDGYTATCSTGDKVVTGSEITVSCNDLIVFEYEAVVFGDVNGDGWYDGQDAVTVSMIAGGMLTREQVGEAVWMAADCNHDGVIDQADVELLNQAGVLLSSVDQTKSTDELFETSSEYVEYLNLIDQQTDADSEETPDNTEENEDPTELSLWNIIVKYFVELIKKFLSVIKVF